MLQSLTDGIEELVRLRKLGLLPGVRWKQGLTILAIADTAIEL